MISKINLFKYLAGVVNLNDFKQPVTNEFHYDVQFGGIDIVLVQDGKEFLDMGLTGITYVHVPFCTLCSIILLSTMSGIS